LIAVIPEPVSVVMPVRNEEPHLEAAVGRVLAQGYGGELEVVIDERLIEADNAFAGSVFAGNYRALLDPPLTADSTGQWRIAALPDGILLPEPVFGQEFSISVSTSWEDFSNEIQSVMPTQKLPVPTEPGI